MCGVSIRSVRGSWNAAKWYLLSAVLYAVLLLCLVVNVLVAD